MKIRSTFWILIFLISCRQESPTSSDNIPETNNITDPTQLIKTEVSDTVELLNNAVKTTPDNAIVYFNRGLFYLSKEKYKDALIDFNKSIEIYPDYAQAYDKRALTKWHIQSTSENYNGYWEDLDKAIKLKPDFAEAYYDRGCLKNYYDNNAPQYHGCEDICKAIMLGYPKDKNGWGHCNCSK